LNQWTLAAVTVGFALTPQVRTTLSWSRTLYGLNRTSSITGASVRENRKEEI